MRFGVEGKGAGESTLHMGLVRLTGAVTVLLKSLRIETLSATATVVGVSLPLSTCSSRYL